MTNAPRPRRLRALIASISAIAALTLALAPASSGVAAQYVRISGQGSSWAANAVSDWQAAVKANGVTVDYTNNGSSSGRKAFAMQVDAQYAVSEIPYRGDTADPKDNSYPTFSFAMMPMVAGGTSLMYNLPIGGKQFTNLKLSQAAAAGIFTGQITRWNDPAIAADNPGVALPDQQLTVVVRSEGSGATAQFTLWLLRQFPALYSKLCTTTGVCDGAHATSYFPTDHLSNFVAQNGSNGVTTYTSSTPYTINYDEYSYALQAGFPVAKIKNAAGFYTVPTDSAVAVALTQAQINTDQSSVNYLSQDLSKVYAYGDPRSYALSAYSYFMVPTQTTTIFNQTHGATLGYFTQYSLCEGQRTMGALGYSPLPMNLVLAAMDQIRKIPGVDSATTAKMDAVKNSIAAADGSNPCNNPTFRPGDSPSHNILVDSAPFPDGCNAACQAPWKLASAATNPGPSYGKGTTAATTTNTAAPSGAATTAATDAPTASSCDPDTGQCGTTLNSSSTGGTIAAAPTVLTGAQGWAGPQTLLVLGIIMAVALFILPPVLATMSRRRKP